MAAQRSLLLALLPCLFVAALASVAVKETVQQHPLTNLPPAGDLSTGYFLPDHPTKQFPAGEEIKVVLGIHNDGSEAYNISSIMGSVNSQDFATYFYNLTHQTYFTVIPEGAELSLEYKFVPHQMLPPATYRVALTVFYEGKEGFKSTTFFNSTVEIVEVKKVVDYELIMLFLLVSSIFAVACYFIYQYLVSLGVFKSFSRKSKKPEAETTTDNDDEWVKGTPYDDLKKRKAAAAAAAAAKKAT